MRLGNARFAATAAALSLACATVRGVDGHDRAGAPIVGQARPLTEIEKSARAIDTLQRGKNSASKSALILTLLRGACPLDRQKVLHLVDRGEDQYDVHHLLFEDLDDRDRDEAIALVNEAETAAKNAGTLELGVISDIDDTAAPMAYTPDGKDFFRGAGDIYNLIDLGTDGKGEPGDVHYVSARPGIFMGDIYGRLRRAGVPAGTIDSGNFFKTIFGGLDGIESGKLEDIDRLLDSTHPAQTFVCLGDARQRDPEVYRETMKRHPGRIALVLIHRAGKDRVESQFSGFVFFDDYPSITTEVSKVVGPGGLPR